MPARMSETKLKPARRYSPAATIGPKSEPMANLGKNAAMSTHSGGAIRLSISKGASNE